MPARLSSHKPPKSSDATGDLSAVGGRLAVSSPHSSRTLMLQEIEAILTAIQPDASAKASARLSAFCDQGYDLMMVTDKSFMRNPLSHQTTNILETLDLQFCWVADGPPLALGKPDSTDPASHSPEEISERQSARRMTGAI